MVAREVERMGVVLQKERLEMGQRIMLAKQAPDTIAETGVTVVELYSLYLGKLLNQSFVDEERLVAIASGRLVLVLTDA